MGLRERMNRVPPAVYTTSCGYRMDILSRYIRACVRVFVLEVGKRKTNYPSEHTQQTY